MEQTTNVFDFLILVDATGSMQTYIDALNKSLPRIISVSALTDCFARIGILAYRDYCGGELVEWSGWYGKGGDISKDDLIKFSKSLKPDYGGDWPEAAKTGLAYSYSVMREEAHTFLLLYTDAPPHMVWNTESNRYREQKRLSEMPFGQSDLLFKDWVSATNTLQHGIKKVQVFAIVQSPLEETLSPFLYMCQRTGGVCLEVTRLNETVISSLSMNLLLSWMGLWDLTAEESSEVSTSQIAKWLRYISDQEIDDLDGENDKRAANFFVQKASQASKDTTRSNIESTKINGELKVVQKEPHQNLTVIKRSKVQDFSKRYASDFSYRATAVQHLRSIIEDDVVSIAINPVFGTLWRAICNDRSSEHRDDLIRDFGNSITKISGAQEKEKLKKWLEESYNYTAEIVATIEQVAPEDCFPYVFLDPTDDWSASQKEDVHEEDEMDQRAINQFTREELLEIGRSCDSRILRRLGRVLTRLTYVASEEKVPSHIKGISQEDLPRIPLALATEKYNRKFWKILLHLVVPGTKLGARPAALLAALSIRIGMKPLLPAADREMLEWKDNWRNLDIPEIWNTNCLSLILDADANFTTRQQASQPTKSTKVDGLETPSDNSLLNVPDRLLFQTLVSYTMLKANLLTTLEARVSWHPDRSKVSIGPLVICKTCQFPRSVTVMSQDGICGLCACPESEYIGSHHGKEKADCIKIHVSQTDTEETEATWVECQIDSCRAQYIVYDTEGLNVRPKCHYCRQKGRVREEDFVPAPCVECTQCLSKIIWPTEYRPDDLRLDAYKCAACKENRETVVSVETTASTLREENGISWMLRNEDRKIQQPLTDSSLFKTISAAGPDNFSSQVEILPRSNSDELRLRGKLVQNAAELKEALRRWISSKSVEAGSCSLCFSDIRKQSLRPACGRSGCHQKICSSCSNGWYGLNSAGKIINIAALSCPFCRRQPTAKAAGGIATLGNLRNAVTEAGSWIYAWCVACGETKPYMERVCAQGPPPNEIDWHCDQCKDGGQELPKFRNCPQCGVTTEKTAGCDHITCPNCEAHWCFYCGVKSTADTIYTHMATEHGGWFGGGDNPDYDDYWTDEDE